MRKKPSNITPTKTIGVNLIIGGENAKQYFGLLLNEKDTIENAIGVPFQLRELPQYKESQIYTGPRPADFTQHGRWPEFYTWIVLRSKRKIHFFVLAGLDPAIHVTRHTPYRFPWIPGTRPGKTIGFGTESSECT